MTNLLIPQLTEQFKSPIDNMIALGSIKDPNFGGRNSSASQDIKRNHRNIILQQGRADFNTDSDGLTASQKVDLYCYYYFQMHFTSTYSFIEKENNYLINLIKNKNIWFVDIGCGPFTSGLAFSFWLDKITIDKPYSVNYIGVDISASMLNKAKSVKQAYGCENFNSCVFIYDKSQVIDNIKNEGLDPNESVIIINYSYLFASHSLDVDEFVKFTKSIINKFYNINGERIIILQQNPKCDELNKNWRDYKNKLAGELMSVSRKPRYPKSYNFAYEDKLESSSRLNHDYDVKCDILEHYVI